MNERKRLIHTLLMSLVVAGTLAGCAETATEEAAAPAPAPAPEPIESTAVLNPNQAGEEELLALPLDAALDFRRGCDRCRYGAGLEHVFG